MRNLIYYVATTIDGFIARRDGSFDGLSIEGEHLSDLFSSFPETVPQHLKKPLGVATENRRFDTVLMGRRTYEVGLNLGITSPYPSLRQIVFSRSLSRKPAEDVELVPENARARVQALKTENGKDIWLCGGGALAAHLFPEIDQLIIKLNPILLGESGIPLFAGRVAQSQFHLTHSNTYPNGFVLLQYEKA